MRASEGFRIGDGSLARHRGLLLASQHPPANEPLPGHPGGGFALGAALDASDLAQRTPFTSLRYLVAYQGSSGAAQTKKTPTPSGSQKSPGQYSPIRSTNVGHRHAGKRRRTVSEPDKDYASAAPW
jgi:hypothetical protein